MSEIETNDGLYRPWTTNYPEGIVWDADIDTTPVHEQILAACAKYADSNAMDFLSKKTTFRNMGRQITAFARSLQKHHGVKKGSRVALLLPNTPFFPVAYYGILLAGGTVVNCNPLYTVHELKHITADSGAEILVTLDLKIIFEKAEALAESGSIKKIIVCHFPDALPTVKKFLFKIAKKGDLANTKTSRVADKIVSFNSLLLTLNKPNPVEINPAMDVAVQQYTGEQLACQRAPCFPTPISRQMPIKSTNGAVASSTHPTKSLPYCHFSTSLP